MARIVLRRLPGRRLFLFALGAGLGAVTVVSYLVERQRRPAPQRQTAGIALTVPPQAESVPLTIEMRPEKLQQGRDATLTVHTTPGAMCLIEARYSTGRPPSSLDARPLKVNEMGVGEWTWTVGTTGSHVTVVVQAWLEGHAVARVERQFEIDAGQAPAGETGN